MATHETHKQHQEHKAEEHKKEEKAPFKFNPLYIIPIVIVIAVIYMAISGATTPVVAVGDNISVEYTGSFTNGTVFDSSVGRAPLTFKVGSGELIQGFDQAVVGMKIGENKTVTIQPAQGYGLVNPALITTVNASVFGNQTVQVGMMITRTTQGGQQVQGKVTAVNATTVTVDFNHPLAGQTLIFNIKVVAINR
ncbi:MAG: peptidylprolyl isomerase [Candidatus Micrarchaeota archaeon]|nr:peptidylprolyl isomerase [Candidatus Micrarchaeota archaeon]